MFYGSHTEYQVYIIYVVSFTSCSPFSARGPEHLEEQDKIILPLLDLSM